MACGNLRGVYHKETCKDNDQLTNAKENTYSTVVSRCLGKNEVYSPVFVKVHLTLHVLTLTAIAVTWHTGIGFSFRIRNISPEPNLPAQPTLPVPGAF